jgi:hypothetical protein
LGKVDTRDLVDTVREGLIVLASKLTRCADRSFYDMLSVAPEDAIGRRPYELGNRPWDIPELRTCLGDGRDWKSRDVHSRMARCAIGVCSLLCGMAVQQTSLSVALRPSWSGSSLRALPRAATRPRVR